ncbi:hypothetical protein ACFYNO_39200 [Kitasatospora sp. NPDC006697]
MAGRTGPLAAGEWWRVSERGRVLEALVRGRQIEVPGGAFV